MAIISSYSCAPQPLHSFPTRRSSDLQRPRFSHHDPLRFSLPPCVGAELAGKTEARSEEHTSELQSHHDLVCRLLLEKKKRMEAAESPAKTNTFGSSAYLANGLRPAPL